MKQRVLRIGVFGGTFDPPHIGHLIIAEQARRQLRLDKVLFVPAFLPPHKKGRTSASALQRLAMLQKAVRGVEGLSVEPIEIDRKGTSYTVDTLKELKTKFNRSRFFLILGGDNFVQFKSWKSVREIRRLATVAVYHRNKLTTGARNGKIGSAVLLRGTLLGISSTLIRQKIRNGESVRFLVPPSVERYIRTYRLYSH